ncbi:deaminase domain-containing protein [Pseudomonas sp. RIT-PI-r]|uniref:deaminase domain-containing protein n=1 Tax=Pseudomonas sp. RIT-PI-r TaxID=1699620 RepID=UPI0006D6B3A6|nr:deaminase domain-containing protein [Pseudomonas sp. RIT-PI-r]KPG93869.1 hypothetical protein AK821_21260 [Pseudomonas sp. RIT-PI-r]
MNLPVTPQQRHTAQQAEYRAMIAAMRAVHSAATSLESFYLSPQAHSRLGLAHDHAQRLFLALIEDAGDPLLTRQLQASKGLTYVSAAADHCRFTTSRGDDGDEVYTIKDVTQTTGKIRQFQRALLSIGGHLRSNRLLPLAQLVSFSGFTLPAEKDASGLARLIDEVEEQRASHRLNLPNSPQLAALMSGDDIAVIHDVIGAFLSGKELSLINYLAREVTPPYTLKQLQTLPATCLERLLDTPSAQRLGQRLLQTLGWYGALPDEQTIPDIAAHLFLEALRLWYDVPRQGHSMQVAGYSLEPRHHYGKSYADIREEFFQHLEESQQASTQAEKALLGWVCLAQFPFDFQVRGIPDDLPYGASAVWVNFVHGVQLAHALDPESLQQMTFQQLIDLPMKKSANANAELMTVITLTRVAAAQTWAMATGARPAAETDDDQPFGHDALQALEDHKAQLNEAILCLDIEPPQRLALAKQQLHRALANDLYDHTRIHLKRHHHQPPNRARRSIFDTPDVTLPIWPLLEVYASGGLEPDTRWYVSDNGKTTSEWISLSADRTLRSGFINAKGPGQPLSRFPHMRTLPDIKSLFDKQFKGYLRKLMNAYEYLIKTQLVTLPWADRQALEHGEVRAYCLRDQAHNIAGRSESPESMQLQRARMGFILRASYRGSEHFYECLPRAGVIRKRGDVSVSHLDGLLSRRPPPKDGKIQDEGLARVHLHRLPFDLNAHKKGSVPKRGAFCLAVLDPLGDALAPSAIPEAHHNTWANLTFTSARTVQISALVATDHLYVDEKALYSEAWGETRFEREGLNKHWIHALKGFIPFWGSLEDLHSNDPGKRALGIFGLLLDIVSFAIPLGKFVAGSIRLAVVAGKMAIRVALPSMAQLSKKLLLSSLNNLNPLDAAPALLSLGGKGLTSTVRAVIHLEKKALSRLKRLAGTSAEYDLLHSLPQALDVGRWKPLSHSDQLAAVKGIDDVPVRNVAISDFSYHVLDPLSERPFGPRLTRQEHDFALGRSSYNGMDKTANQITIKLPEKTRVQHLPEADGHHTVLIDDAPYRLDGEELRRVDLIDDSRNWTLLPCRPRRAPGRQDDCRVSYTTGEPAPTPALGTVDKDKGYAPWFGDRISEPAALARQNGTFLAVDAKLYRILDNRPTLFRDDLARLGFRNGRLIPRQQIQATLQFRKGIFARVKTGGSYDGINDTHQIGAILVPAIDDSASYVFLRINSHEYYLASIRKGEIPGNRLTFNRLSPAELANDTLGAELLTVYTGSLHANNIVRIHGLEAVQRAMHTMEQIAIPIGTSALPANNMKWLKVDTSPGEALMFDHSTRMIVTRLPEGAATWARSKEAPEAFRLKTAEIFDTLFLSPTINPANSSAALRIDGAMQKLQNLLPMRERPLNPRNIAFAEVTTASGQREIYVSVSGAQGSTQRLPLFRHMGGEHVRIGQTTYINIDYNSAFPRTSLEVTEQGQLLAVPLTIKELKTYQPTQTSRPTSLDSESKLISVIREKYPDPTEIRAIDIATTMRPCESCSVVMKQFGHDGGDAALQVLWG